MSRSYRAVPDDLAADAGPEDGQDPRHSHHRDGVPTRAGRKAGQLCEQVRRAVHQALAGAADEVLQTLAVSAVEPAPHTGRLRVTVAVPADIGPAAARAVLSRAAGRLRAEVAAAVNRRNAPELVFEVTG